MTDSIDDIFRDADSVIGLYGSASLDIQELGPKRLFSWDDYNSLKDNMVSLRALSNKYPTAKWIKEQIATLRKYGKEELRPWIYKRIFQS